MTPEGEIVAAPWRGAMMGNRGCLHGPDNTLGRARWRHANWVCCVTEFRGRHRLPMPPPGSPTVYTALFFWDEAAAFAAGHRPCAECRNADWRRFRAVLERVLGPESRGAPASALDRALHRDRLQGVAPKHPARHEALAADLPDGTFVRLSDGRAGCLWADACLPWRQTGGYDAPVKRPMGTVEVLTPSLLVATFHAGYRPVIRA
ncbi:MAG: hypothetical protein AAF675_07210 [Pseudomonadota bacterium]